MMLDDIYVGTASKSDASKSLTGYNVYLDGVEKATGIQSANYTFENVPAGIHTAGVKAIYSSGESEMVTMEFFMDGAFEVTFNVVDEDNAPITDAIITLGDVTNNAGDYVFNNVLTGEYEYAVTKDGYGTITGTISVTGNATQTVVLQTSGIDANSISNLKLYPNPFRDEIIISNPAPVNRIQITNASGQKVRDVLFDGKSINTSDLSNGVYFITVESFDGKQAVHKMIKK